MPLARLLLPAALLACLSACSTGTPAPPPAPPQSSLPPQVSPLPDTHHRDMQPLPQTLGKPPEGPIPDYEQVMLDSGLVDVQSLDSRILVELKYSTEDNFVHYDIYGDLEKAYLRPLSAQKLVKAQQLLDARKPGYHLLVYDAARPRRVQYTMWDLLQMPNKRDYLAPPAEGSIHNYGLAVDLTIADERGSPLDMGTPYDFFGPLAQPKLEQQYLTEGKLTREQLDNRLLLRAVMKEAGFTDIKTEWWHFNGLTNEEAPKRFRMIE